MSPHLPFHSSLRSSLRPHKSHAIACLVIGSFFLALSQAPERDLESQLHTAAPHKQVEILDDLMDEYSRKDPQKVLEYGHRALRLLEEHPQGAAEGKIRNRMSVASYRLGDYSAALTFAHQGEAIAEELDDTMVLRGATNMLGTLYASQGAYDKALEAFSRNLESTKRLGDDTGTASALHNMAIVYRNLGDFDRALELNLQAVRINEKLGRETEMARTFNSIGSLYHSMGSDALALEYLQKSMAIHEKEGDKLSLAPVLNNMGEIEQVLGNYDRALEYLNRSLAIKKEYGARSGIAYTLDAIGQVYLETNAFDTAQDHLLDALEIFEDVGEQRGILQTRLNLGVLYQRWGRVDDAFVQIERVLAMAEASQAKAQSRNGYKILAELQESRRNYRGALDSFKKFKTFHDQIINEETGLKVGQLQARFDADQRAKEIALLKKDNEIQALEVERQILLRKLWVFGTVGAAVLIGLAIFIFSRRTQQKNLERKVEERTHALVEIQAQMVETAHRAGMAEIAIDVLHNVGNTLNSVHASAGMLLENLHNSKPLEILDGIVKLIEQHEASLETFIAADRRGQAIPQALSKISVGLKKKQTQLIDEVVQLKKGLNAINDLIKAQDRYAHVPSSGEEIDLPALIAAELEQWQDDLKRDDIRLIQDLSPVPKIFSQKFKLKRLIEHLMQNAIEALQTCQPEGGRRITIRTGVKGPHWVTVTIQDNGTGISASHIDQIFSHGFTTKPDAQGTGLHFCANAVTELGGRIRVQSDGENLGARFVMELPNPATSGLANMSRKDEIRSSAL